MRFAGAAGQAVVSNPAELLQRIEEEKRLREERAAKFGVVVVNADLEK